MSERAPTRAPVAPLLRARLRRVAVAAVLVGLAVAVGRAAVDREPPGTIAGAPDGAAPSVAPVAATGLPPLVDGPDRPAEVDLPRREAGVRRAWWALGTWWAVLPDPATGTHHIWGLTGPEGAWVDTGTFVDERLDAQLEVGWDGEDLVVAASGPRPYRGHALRVHRYSWSPGDEAWVAAPDHPLEITAEGEPGARMALAADGTAWFVRSRGLRLEVGRTAGRAARWGGWAPLPLGAADGDVGGFDLVADGADVVVVVRRASTDALVVVRRSGTTWADTEVAVPDVAGQGPVDAEAAPGGGALSALLPTTATDAAAGGSQAPALLLVALPGPGAARGGARAGAVSVVARAGDGLQQAALVVDGRRARVVATAPPTADEVGAWYVRGRAAPTALVVKDAPLADPVFGPGPGRRLTSGVDGADVARPLLPVAVTPDSGLVAIASADDATRWTTWADGVAPAAQPPPPATGGATVLVDDGFDTLAVGGPGPTSWAPDGADPPAGTVVDDPATGSRALRIDGGPDPASVCRAIPVLPATTLTVSATLRAEGAGTADARLLTVRGSGGSVASVRQSRQGLVGWSTGAGRVTSGTVPPGVPLQVTVRLDLAARTAAITVRTPDGTVLAEGSAIPWLTASERVDELCTRAAPGPGTTVVADDIRVVQE